MPRNGAGHARLTPSSNDKVAPVLGGLPKALMVDRIASFALDATNDHIPREARALLKRNVLDSLACAIAALGGEPDIALREQFAEYRGSEQCTLIGGGRTSPDQAAFLNSVLVRYVDLLDTYMTPGGLCHPADNFGAILAAAEMNEKSGADFLLALAVAYEIQCRFSQVVPVMYRGLNHALQLSMSVAAGSAKLFGLHATQTANAIAIAAADNVSLAVVHAEPVSQWKGLSPGISAMRAIYATSLARRGLTGPRGLFEGPNGLNRLFDQTIEIDWDYSSLDAVNKTVLKKYSALIHGQNVIEAVLTLKKEHSINPEDVIGVTADVFQFAYDIAGGGHFGDKENPTTKEQADYNLKYLIAAALIDGEVGPDQLAIDRILRPDIQDLLRKVRVVSDEQFTKRYPKDMIIQITIELRDGRKFQRKQNEYEGAASRPLSWERIVEKFHWLCEPFAGDDLREQIIGAVADIERIKISDLTHLLGQVSCKTVRPRTRKAI